MNERDFRRQASTRVQLSLVFAADVEDYLQVVIAHTAALVGVEGSYSISTTLYGMPLTVASSERDAWDIDQVEFDTNSGPCLDALRQGVTTHVDDLRREYRWPDWVAAATALGFHSAAAVSAAPDNHSHRLILNLYSRTPTAFNPEALRRGEIFLIEVAQTIPIALRTFGQSKTVSKLQAALASRSTIDQALGVLMVQDRCTREEAFGRLRRVHGHRSVKLRDAAAAISRRPGIVRR